jgi:excisionase family DNA binding protein
MDPAYAARLLGCEESTIEELCRQGKLPAKKWGVGWMLPTAAVLHVINNVALIEAAERAQGPKDRPAATIVPFGDRKPPQLPDLTS